MPVLSHAPEAALPQPRRTLVHDTSTHRDGILMDMLIIRNGEGRVTDQEVFLRPPEGGTEWVTTPSAVTDAATRR